MSESDLLKKVVALCKRRGIIFPGSMLYGGFANTYSYGPMGVLLKQQIKDLWWKKFVQKREDIVGLDGPILLHPRTWEASGHVAGFNDALIDCKSCKARLRADHLIEKGASVDCEGRSLEEMNQLVHEHNIVCPKCGAFAWTDARLFNLMFSTELSKTGEEEQIAYLRPETAQAIFLDYKNILDSTRVQVPFGIAQIGKAFRNEITPGNFVFRLIEFEQMEIEYFIREEMWEELFEAWLEEMKSWCNEIGLKGVELKEHPKEKLSHYSKRTVDLVYPFPFGTEELWGLAYRTDFDLSRHASFSKKPLLATDPKTGEKFLPHVLEPTFGVDRTLLALLCQAYREETLENGESRVVLGLLPKIAPIKAAIFPLMKKDGLPEIARSIFSTLSDRYHVEYDEGGNIGKRYRRQDEIGTPYCITVDYQTKEEGTVTVRDRDTMAQERIAIEALPQKIAAFLNGDECLGSDKTVCSGL